MQSVLLKKLKPLVGYFLNVEALCNQEWLVKGHAFIRHKGIRLLEHFFQAKHVVVYLYPSTWELEEAWSEELQNQPELYKALTPPNNLKMDGIFKLCCIYLCVCFHLCCTCMCGCHKTMGRSYFSLLLLCVEFMKTEFRSSRVATSVFTCWSILSAPKVNVCTEGKCSACYLNPAWECGGAPVAEWLSLQNQKCWVGTSCRCLFVSLIGS